MFGPKHYVPILRWKRAERAALGMLRPADRAVITPLLELTPKLFAPKRTKKNELRIPDPNQVLTEAADDMYRCWGQAPFLLDLWHLNPLPQTSAGLHPLAFLAERCRMWRLPMIPVTGLQRPNAYQDAVSSIVSADNRGICVRLLVADLGRGNLDADLSGLLRRFGVSHSQTDLLVDCQFIADGSVDLCRLLSQVPEIREWRTLTIASGAFPRDLTGMQPGQHFLDRWDWLAWRAYVRGPSRPRTAAYADYTIQHADFKEPPERANLSASIRYTIDQYWLVMRGESVFKEDGPGFSQWPANAQLLSEHREFRGRDFSYGDQYILDMGSQVASTGNAETWLRAGINHHMTFVARQVANLPGL